jgi:hypothetical protein
MHERLFQDGPWHTNSLPGRLKGTGSAHRETCIPVIDTKDISAGLIANKVAGAILAQYAKTAETGTEPPVHIVLVPLLPNNKALLAPMNNK